MARLVKSDRSNEAIQLEGLALELFADDVFEGLGPAVPIAPQPDER